MMYKRILVLVSFVFFVAALAVSANDSVRQLNKLPGIIKQAKVTITSPQGGQVLQVGEQATVSWDYSGNIGEALFINLVHLSGDPAWHGVFNVILNPQAPAGSGGHGSYTWVVPEVPTGYTYTIQISSPAADTGAGSQKFTIVNPKQQPTITVTSPNGGETWYTGQTYNITWSHIADPGQKVMITLVPSGDPAKFRKLGEAVLGTNGIGSFACKIPGDVVAGKDYQIWLANGAYNKKFLDHSDNNFTIAKTLAIKPNNSTILTNKPKTGAWDKLDPQPEPPGE